jgi:hypothetical protein
MENDDVYRSDTDVVGKPAAPFRPDPDRWDRAPR